MTLQKQAKRTTCSVDHLRVEDKETLSKPWQAKRLTMSWRVEIAT